jgi:hypothetical protein
MVQHPSWEAEYHSVRQEIQCLLWNSDASYYIQNSMLLYPTVRYLNSVQIFTKYTFEIYFNISSHLFPGPLSYLPKTYIK